MNTFVPKDNIKPLKIGALNGKRLCRNVIIHGFCKFEDKGCEFNHENGKTFVLPQTRNTTVSAGSIHAPVFVPKSTSQQDRISVRPIITDPSYNRFNNLPSGNPSFSPFALTPTYAPNYQQSIIPNNNSDPYYYMSNTTPQYHQYQPTLPHIANLSTHHRVAQSFLIPDNLKEQLLKRNEISILTVSAKERGLPDQVHVYHSLYPLEDTPGNILGHASWVYKAVCKTTGKHYTMVRIEGFRLVNEKAMSIVKQWRRIKHANIVAIREAFTTRAFGDSSLVFVYDYHPCSITLYEAYFSPHAQALLSARLQAAGINGLPVPETTLWSFITQIASALKTIHNKGFSARTIEPNKILMTNKNRLRLNCPGLLDLIQFDHITQNMPIHQQEDLLSFGKLIVTLACHSTKSSLNLSQSFEYIARFYSPDIKNLVLYLFSKPVHTKSIDNVFKLIGPRILHELNSSQYYTDALETNLSHELENGRIVRLLSKLAFISERPEFDHDPRWSETGDRYMIKLFRDYMFHQVNEMGVPITDMSHVITCLNKLDVGVEEKISLRSRDEQTSIIVSYKELKTCIHAAFQEISS
ncbi:kinase-like domain-containing protein [Pilaira anomala]|nr:kinase-like domain-containing protein [Pilaira anomala]